MPVGLGREHRGGEPSQAEPGEAAVDEELGEGGGVLGAQERRRAADPDQAVAAGDVADQVLQRLRHPGGAGLLEDAEQLVGGAPGVQGPADGVGAEPVHRRRAAGLDVGGEVDVGGQGRGERTGGDGREVGLDEQVVDGLREQGGEGVPGGRRVVAQQGAGRRGERALPGEPEPLGLLEEPGDEVVAAGSGAAGGAVVEAGEDLLAGRGVVGGDLGELEQDVSAQGDRARPADVVGQRAPDRAGAVAGPDEGRDDGRAQPRRGQRHPAHVRRLLQPHVGGQGRHPRRGLLAVGVEQARGVGELGDERGDALVDVERGRDPSQLADPQPARAADREGGAAGDPDPSATSRTASAADPAALCSAVPARTGSPVRAGSAVAGWRWVRPPRSVRPTSRGTTTSPGSGTASRPWRSSQPTGPSSVADPACSPTGEPHSSRSSTSGPRGGPARAGRPAARRR